MTMTVERTCKKCGATYEGHGNSGYCDACRTFPCACGCGETVTVQKPFLDLSERYVSKEHMKNHALRTMVAERHGSMTAREIAEANDVSRQRVSQICVELGVRCKRGRTRQLAS